jgi:conjugative relaxase-like TrwC/TraI family protein
LATPSRALLSVTRSNVMVSIGKLSVGQERYYLEQAGERVDAAASLAGAEDYYLDPSEARGEWAGTAAGRLGLTGAVGAEPLRRLMAGRLPHGAEVLCERGARARVAAYDVTFSAPKSVSVLFAVGDDEVTERVRAAHELAVREALGYLERSAAAVRRGHNGLTVLPADGFVAAAFRHRASRAGDPQLHTHVVVANLGHGPDGRWSALDGRRVYGHARAASAVYQSVLRGELTRTLGVRWTPVERGIAEVAGVPRPVMRAFSRRRAEIERALADHGGGGGHAAQGAALATRHAKRHIDAHELERQWRQRAAELGFDRKQVARIVGHARERRWLDEPTWRRIQAELVAPGGLTKERSSFTRRDMLLAVCDRLPADAAVDARDLERLVDLALESREIVPLLADGSTLDRMPRRFRRRDGRVLPVAQGEQRYTTAELLKVEQRLLRLVEAGRGLGAGACDQRAVARALRARASLAGEQVEMVRRLARDGDGIAVVAGRAGTGKTFALAAAREAWQATGHHVIGAAVARRAAAELERGAGIPSTSVHDLLRRPLPPGSVVVIDEAGMLGTRQLTRLAERVRQADGKLVLVGDQRQLPEIDAGGAFRALARRPDTIRLQENRRQTEAWERDAVEHLRFGRAAPALDLYDRHGRLTVTDSMEDARERLVADWWAAGGRPDTLMIAARRRDVDALNRLARDRLRAAGRLGDEVGLLGRRFAVGDRIVIRRNHHPTGLHNGDLGQITAVDPDRLSIQIRLDRDGRTVTPPLQFLLTESDDGERRARALAHGYAVTGHVAQGLTTDRAYILAGPGLSREWAYAAMTRGRHANHLYAAPDHTRHEYAPTDRERDPRADLTRALERSEAEPLALERGTSVRQRDRQRGIEL